MRRGRAKKIYRSSHSVLTDVDNDFARESASLALGWKGGLDPAPSIFLRPAGERSRAASEILRSGSQAGIENVRLTSLHRA